MAHGLGTELRIRLSPTPVGEHTRPMDYNIMQHLKEEALTERQRRTVLPHYHQGIAHISPNTTPWPLLTRSKMAEASSALTSQPQYSRTEALRGALRIPRTGSLRSSTDRPAEPCRSFPRFQSPREAPASRRWSFARARGSPSRGRPGLNNLQIQAKLQIYLWLGSIKHKKFFPR